MHKAARAKKSFLAKRASGTQKASARRNTGNQKQSALAGVPSRQFASPPRYPIIGWIFLGLIILFVVFVRSRLLGFPLERDEGEYAYMGQLVQQGIPPYSLAFSMKLPGTCAMYAIIMSLFGQTISGVHLGLMASNCITILLIYKIGVKTVSSTVGVIAACSYALLSLSPSVLGFAGHATHYVVLWAMTALLVLLYAQEKNKAYLFFSAGLLFALAFIMKQHGIFLALFGAIYVVAAGRQERGFTWKRALLNLGIFLMGFLLTISFMISYLIAVGVFKKFWFFNVLYSLKYTAQAPFSSAVGSFLANFPPVLGGFKFMWIFAALGIISLFYHPNLRNNRVLILLFTACSFLTVCPGFYFRPHYFIALLPAVALLIGIFIDYLSVRLGRSFGQDPSLSIGVGPICIAIAVFSVALIVGVVNHSEYLFRGEPASLCRSIYGANPFPESIEVARFIERNTSTVDKIAILGSEPEICFYAHRHSATGHLYTYGLMETHAYSLDMQKEMVQEIERSNPKFIVFVNAVASWLVRPESERYIFNWAEVYLKEHYNLAGIADIISSENTVYKWQEEARNYAPQSAVNLLVFQRQ